MSRAIALTYLHSIFNLPVLSYTQPDDEAHLLNFSLIGYNRVRRIKYVMSSNWIRSNASKRFICDNILDVL